MEPADRGSRRTLAALLLLLVLTRAILVLGLADVFFLDEEGAKCAAGKALLDGIGVPAWQLSYAYHEGGGFLVSHLDALFSLVLGPCVLVPKLVAILTTSLLLVLGFRFTEGLFGTRAAAILGLLFALCPVAYLRASLLALGTHFEALIPITLVLHHGLRAAFAERDAARDWALLGLFAGLGLYVSLQTAPAIAAVALALLVRRRLSGRGIALALAGFAVGAIPLGWSILHVGTAALRIRADREPEGGLVGFAALLELVRPLVLDLDPWSWLRVIGIGSVIALGWRAVRARAAVLLAYVAVFLVAYASIGRALPYGGLWDFWLRSAPLWFVATVLFAGCAGNLLSRPASRAGQATIAVLVLLLAAGLADFAGLLRRGRPGHARENAALLLATKGYDLQEYFDKLVHHFDEPLPERYAILARFREEPETLLPAAMHSLFEHSGLGLPEAIEFARTHAGERWQTALLGLGLLAAPRYGHDLPAAFAIVEAQPPEVRPALAEAVGRIALGLKTTPETIEGEARTSAPEPLREPFLRGAGWRVHRLYRMRPDMALALIERLPEESRPAVLQGYLAARAANELK